MSRADPSRDPALLAAGQYRNDANLRARAALHERFGKGPPWHPWVLSLLPDDAGLAVLELGCGPGRLWAEGADTLPPDWRLTLTDLSPGMLDAARRVLKGRNPAIRFERLEATELRTDPRFADAAFDVVVANHMLYHVPDIDAVLVGVRRVLRPGGRLFAATNGPGHMREVADLAYRELRPATPLARPALSFDLDNGEAQLRRHFGRVLLHRRDDTLEVDDPAAIVAYAASIVGVAGRDTGSLEPGTAAALERVRVRAARAVDTLGAFRVTRSTGVFEAS